MLEVQAMLWNDEAEKEAIRPDFNKSIFVDFAGAKINVGPSNGSSCG